METRKHTSVLPYMYTASLAVPKFNMITRSRESLPVTHRCW